MELDGGRARVTAPDGIEVEADWDGARLRWSITNTAATAIAVPDVRCAWPVRGAVEPVRMFRHGYQSWSPSDWGTVGVDDDPSRTPGAISLVVDMHHADPRIADAGELRSELVTELRDRADDSPIVLGFDAAHVHDGTFRLRRVGHELELIAQAYLGGALLEPGETLELHDVRVHPSRDAWARRAGRDARAGAPFQIGWCSWYHYFEHVTEDDLDSNLARAEDWPFEVFQLDDGYQTAIGDWLGTNDKFTSTLAELASRIAQTGMQPGIWLAPFLVAPDSAVARAHPEWIAQHASGRPLVGMSNEHWGGFVHALDTTRPDVVEHLQSVASALVDAGFSYLKLDFTYAPGLDGVFADRAQTPAQRVRAAFEAIRAGAGDDTFLLGCGAPLGPTVGIVDGMRIGPDVAPWWDPPADRWQPPGYDATGPSTANALRAVEARQFLHRRLWLNDPDCVMLRTTDTALSSDEARRWAHAVGDSGGMVLVSDDLALLDVGARDLFDDVVARGRAADAIAIVNSDSEDGFDV